MQNLVKGVHHFQNQLFEEHRELFEQLSDGQAPSTLFITCSDSRIVPNLFTQTSPGELFTLRNAGNIVPPYGASNGGESPTIEYAISILGVEHVVVCGHTGCGAMKALMKPESVAHMPAIANWLNQAEATRRIVNENYPEAQGEDRIDIAIKENVLVQIENLETHPSIRAGLGRRKIKLHAWIYSLQTGQVLAYSDETESFRPLAESHTAP